MITKSRLTAGTAQWTPAAQLLLPFSARRALLAGRDIFQIIELNIYNRQCRVRQFPQLSPTFIATGAAMKLSRMRSGCVLHLLHRGTSLTDDARTGVNPAGDAGDTSPNILVGGTSTGISPNVITYFRI